MIPETYTQSKIQVAVKDLFNDFTNLAKQMEIVSHKLKLFVRVQKANEVEQTEKSGECEHYEMLKKAFHKACGILTAKSPNGLSYENKIRQEAEAHWQQLNL